jgi:hypothetical protein
MNVVVFASGLGYGHAARASILNEKFGWPLISYGDGVTYCKEQGIPCIDAGIPLKLNGAKLDAEVEKLIPMESLKIVKEYFDWADVVVVDTCVIGVLLADFFGKDIVLIANDTQTASLTPNTKPLAKSLLLSIYGKAKKILVPDLPPPFTVSLDNLHPALGYKFVGPLVKLPPQKNGPEVVISPKVPWESDFVRRPARFLTSAKVYVHHGGHTSVMEGLVAGVPQIAVTDLPERENNAKGLERLGIGINIPYSKFTSEGLEIAIEIAKEKMETAKRWSEITRRFKAAERVRAVVEELV